MLLQREEQRGNNTADMNLLRKRKKIKVKAHVVSRCNIKTVRSKGLKVNLRIYIVRTRLLQDTILTKAI